MILVKLNINEEEKADNSGSFSEEAEENYSDQENLADAEEEDFTESEDEEEIEEFKQNYLELIKSVETDGEIVFELPILPWFPVIRNRIQTIMMKSKAETDTEKALQKTIQPVTENLILRAEFQLKLIRKFRWFR